MRENLQSRLLDLDDNVKQNLELLKEYEDALRYEDDPLRITKYKKKAEKIKESSSIFEQEYQELQLLLNQQSSIELTTVTNQLETIQQGINKLQAGQKAIFENINSLHINILSKFDKAEQDIVSSILKKIDDNQLSYIDLIIQAIEDARFSVDEINQLSAVAETITKLKIDSIPVETKNMIGLLTSPEVSNKHKLILSIPIIPLILNCETEIEISSKINIFHAWKMLTERIKGNN
jgi:hypothetical protein